MAKKKEPKQVPKQAKQEPSNKQQRFSWRETIATFASVTGFVSTVVAWLDIVQHGKEGYQNFLWAGIIVFIVFWGMILLQLYRRKNIYLNIWLAVTVIALVVAGVWWTSYKKAEEKRIKAREEKLIVLIAKFDGPEEVYGLRNEIIEKLNVDFPKGGEVEIETIDEVITPEKGGIQARELGKNIQADVVIWGWYRATENPNITIHIENLIVENIIDESSIYESEGSIVDLESFELQKKIGTRTASLINFLRGYLYYKSNEYSSALDLFNASYNQSDTNEFVIDKAFILLFIGNSHFALGQNEIATIDFEQVVKLKPNDPMAYYNLGNVYSTKNEKEKALEYYTIAISLNPDHYKAYNNRGKIYNSLGMNELAIEDYSHAILHMPDAWVAYTNRGNAYADMGAYELGLADQDSALKLNPEYSTAYNNKGWIYYKMGEYDKAIKEFDIAIQIDPNYILAYINRGNSYHYLSKNEKALEDYNKVIEIDPENADAYRNRGLVYEILGKTADAELDFAKYQELIGKDTP